MRQIAWLALAALSACAQGPLRDQAASAGTSASPGARDARLLRDMVDSDLAQMASGKLAASKAATPQVRRFGQQMIGEHSEFLKERKQMARARSFSLPELPDRASQDAINALALLSGTGFDRAYAQGQVRSQAGALELLREAASRAADPALRKHAEDTIPSVKADLKKARELAAETSRGSS